MCFSATASFSSAAILVASGGIALSLNIKPQQRAFLCIPFFFGIQQMAEGLVWITIDQNPIPWAHTASVNLFVILAFVLWPAWLPWSVQKMETSKKQIKWLMVLKAMGFFFASVALYTIVGGNAKAQIVGHCLNYSIEQKTPTPFSPNLHAILYFSSTVLSFFVSSHQWVRRTGALIFLGLIITQIVWKNNVTSVWCFFAALASFYICLNSFKQKIYYQLGSI